MLVFFENQSRKLRFHSNLTRITAVLHEDQYTFLTISRSFLLRMKNVSDEICIEIESTHFKFNNFIFSKIVPFMRQCGKIFVETNRPQMTIWRTRISYWIPKATDTHSAYVTLIAFPLRTKAVQCYVILHCLSCYELNGNEMYVISNKHLIRFQYCFSILSL